MGNSSSNFFDFSGITKCTLAITQKCNLACDYCYIQKKDSVMTLSTAQKIIDFIFEITPKNEKIAFGFFGGEPLLEFNLIRKVTAILKNHDVFDPDRMEISISTNGTIFSEDIADFLMDNNIILCVSCDGPAIIQNAFRHFPDGRGCSDIVDKNLIKLLEIFPLTPVNAVYSPENLHLLPEVVDYLSSLGVKNISLNHNISAEWTKKEIDMLPLIYSNIGKRYMDSYRNGVPKYISLIDSKIAVIFRGGYKPRERCRMGEGEFAFAPSGNIFLCERLIGSDDEKTHCIGNINSEFTTKERCKLVSSSAINSECMNCGVRDYCMNWCGCTNYYSTGNYNRVAPFMCASEKASIRAAFQVIQDLKSNGLDLSHHAAGTPLLNVIREAMKESEHLQDTSTPTTYIQQLVEQNTRFL